MSDEMTGEELFALCIPPGPNFKRFFDAYPLFSGTDLPLPLYSFKDMALSPQILANLARMGYDKPTPVQSHSAPAVWTGRDVVGVAETGCGKTAAYLLPLLQLLLKDGPAPPGHVKGLVVVPTRELAIQVQREAQKFSYDTGLRVRLLYGGTGVNRQRDSIRAGADLVVATAGRLCDFIKNRYVSVEGLRYFAVDEADYCVHKGFLEDVEKAMLSQLPELGDIQVLMFSATFPDSLRQEVNRFLHPNFIFTQIGSASHANRDISQKFVQKPNHEEKLKLVKEMVKEDLVSYHRFLLDNPEAPHRKRTLIFTESRRVANEIATLLIKEGEAAAEDPALAPLVKTRPIHSHEEQEEREQFLNQFAYGHMPVLIATDLMARGMDVPAIDHVIQFELPRPTPPHSNLDTAISQYVQRIGRTGRVGNPGRATAFFDLHDVVLAPRLVKVLADALQDIPGWLLSAAKEAKDAPVSNHSTANIRTPSANHSNTSVNFPLPSPLFSSLIGFMVVQFQTSGELAY